MIGARCKLVMSNPRMSTRTYCGMVKALKGEIVQIGQGRHNHDSR